MAEYADSENAADNLGKDHHISVPLESILCTAELKRRPARSPDYEQESRALVALVEALAESPRTILQTLADTILHVCRAGSAGISLLSKEDGQAVLLACDCRSMETTYWWWYAARLRSLR